MPRNIYSMFSEGSLTVLVDISQFIYFFVCLYEKENKLREERLLLIT